MFRVTEYVRLVILLVSDIVMSGKRMSLQVFVHHLYIIQILHLFQNLESRIIEYSVLSNLPVEP